MRSFDDIFVIVIARSRSRRATLKKVLLINPPFYQYGGIEGFGGHLIPLNLCYLAAYAREKHPDVEFRILDSEALGYNRERTVAVATQFAPDLIGITATTSAFNSIIDLIRLLKEALPNTLIIVGGPHPSALPERSLKETEADFVAVGEGEMTLAELISHRKDGGTEPVWVNGLAYLRKDGSYQRNAPRQLINDLDMLPFPARDLLDNSLYRPPPSKRVGAGPNTMVSTSRGCPHNCGFCSARSVWTRRVRFRSPTSVVDEIAHCVKRYGITSVNFTDEYLTAVQSRVIRICELIREHEIKFSWVCSSRAEKLDEETLQAMKSAGCKEISFGIESGNPDILVKIDKKLDLDEALKVVSATKRVGISTHASYMLGYPGETEETMKETIRFAKKLNTDIAAFFIACPLPGSRLYDEACEKGYIRPNATWYDYSPLSNTLSVMALPNMSPETIWHWHRKALRSYYLRPRYVISRLLSLRHWYEIQNLVAGFRAFLSIKR